MWLAVALAVALSTFQDGVVDARPLSSWRKAIARLAVSFRFQQRITPVAWFALFAVEANCVVNALLTFTSQRITIADTIRIGISTTRALHAWLVVARITKETVGANIAPSASISNGTVSADDIAISVQHAGAIFRARTFGAVIRHPL